MAEAKLDLVPQDVTGGYALFWVRSIEVSVTNQRAQYEPRKVTVELAPPDSSPIQLAVQLHPGAGTQPDNTLAMQDLADQIQRNIIFIERAIDETIKQSKQGDW